MSGRLRRIAAQNEQIVADGWYTTDAGAIVHVRDAVSAAVTGTVSYPPEGRLGLTRHRAGDPTVVEVTGEDSLTAARRLVRPGAGPVAVLCFASARNPGGGYRNGARAQEEDLCRGSLLYPCLLRAPDFYAAHRSSPDLAYSDRVIWSPDVPVHRDRDGRLLTEPFLVSFLTSAAPNAGELLGRDPDAVGRIGAVLRRRTGRVLAVAAAHGVRGLVLGAWGCGVFGNEPWQVAAAFREHLVGGQAGAFDHVVFAVWGRGAAASHRSVFAEVFGDLSGG